MKAFRTRLLSIALSLMVSVILLAVKFYTYHITHSSAVLSDALESIINVVAAGFALVSIILAAAPPDKSHPYGHGKIEFFSAGFEGLLIALAAIGIFWTGIPRIFNPLPLPRLESGLLLMAATSGVNLLLGLFLIRMGKKTDSLTLMADGRHVLTDVYTTVGVILGLVLVYFTGWYRLDGIVACAVGVNILFTGMMLVRKSFGGLMDESDPELLQIVSETICRHRRENWIDIHQLRAFRSGALINIDLHLILPADLTLETAHQEADEMEQLIIRRFDGRAVVIIHMDPCTDDDCPVCGKFLCEHRARSQEKSPTWPWQALVRQETEK
ncbi:MAG: cation diffusion facilitator family transporter [Thermodesulfobacteriota bacterium]